MIDPAYLTNNLEAYKKNLENRQLKAEDFHLDKLKELVTKRKELSKRVQDLERQRNLLSGRVPPFAKAMGGKEEMERAKELKAHLQEAEGTLREIQKGLDEALLNLPNMASPDSPIGKSDSENVLVREVGEKPHFPFTPKDYLSLAGDLIDTARASKVAGTRFGYLFGDLALLEFALVDLAFKTLIPQNFMPVIPPVMIKPQVFAGMGRLSKGDEDQRYHLEKDNLYLAGSAEHTIGPIHMNETLKAQELPKRYLGFSTCFRREAGSYGKDTKGILRVHQFDKVEMFSFTLPEESEKEHQFLLAKQEELMQKVGLPYRVMQICTGDIGFPDYKAYDIETWMPGEGRYRETHSCSNTTDFQARGVNVRYKKEGKSAFIHMLNATAFAIGRTLIAILENYQQKDGSINVPPALQSYVGKDIIKCRAN